MWNLSVLKMPPKKKHYIKVKPARGSVLVSAPRKRAPVLKFGGLKKPAFSLASLFKPPVPVAPLITLPGQDIFPDAPDEGAGVAPQIVGPGQDIVKSVPEGPVETIKDKMKGMCEKLGIPCWMVGVGGLAALWIIFK